MGYTTTNKLLTPALKNVILQFVIDNNANPTGIWKDFHCVHRSWRNLNKFVQAGLILESDLPAEPDPADYPDVLSQATIQCPETFCLDCSKVYGCACINCSRSGEDPSGSNTTTSWSNLSYLGWDIFTYSDWDNFVF